MLNLAIEKYAQRIEHVDMTILKECEGNREIFKMLNARDLREFSATYLSLATLLARLRRSTRTDIAFARPPG